MKYNKQNGAVLGRRVLNELFGQKSGRPNAVCWKLEKFVMATLAESSWADQTAEDLEAFNEHFKAHDMWPTFLTVPHVLGHEDWTKDVPRVEMVNGQPKWAIFADGEQQTDWEYRPYQTWVLEGILNKNRRVN